MEQTINIEELIQDDHNFNKGTEAGQKLMEKSFKELGAGRSILVDRDGRIISGNKSQKAAMAAGIQKVRVIETTGDELIAVKRTDLSLDSKEGREMAYADNLSMQVNLATKMDEDLYNEFTNVKYHSDCVKLIKRYFNIENDDRDEDIMKIVDSIYNYGFDEGYECCSDGQEND